MNIPAPTFPREGGRVNSIIRRLSAGSPAGMIDESLRGATRTRNTNGPLTRSIFRRCLCTHTLRSQENRTKGQSPLLSAPQHPGRWIGNRAHGIPANPPPTRPLAQHAPGGGGADVEELMEAEAVEAPEGPGVGPGTRHLGHARPPPGPGTLTHPPPSPLRTPEGPPASGFFGYVRPSRRPSDPPRKNSQ